MWKWVSGTGGCHEKRNSTSEKARSCGDCEPFAPCRMRRRHQSVIDQQPTSSGPTITTISPNSTVAGGAAFTLTINGTNFVAASMVNFGGAARTTTFVNSTQLTAAIPAASIASTGTLAVTVTPRPAVAPPMR